MIYDFISHFITHSNKIKFLLLNYELENEFSEKVLHLTLKRISISEMAMLR